jgi:hypothetical protein
MNGSNLKLQFKENNNMEDLKLFERKAPVVWKYDSEADTLYFSFGKPRAAVGMDIGEGRIRFLPNPSNP